MSELVRELRRHARDYASLAHGPLCGNAADEIDRLREALRSILDARNDPYEIAQAALRPVSSPPERGK